MSAVESRRYSIDVESKDTSIDVYGWKDFMGPKGSNWGVEIFKSLSKVGVELETKLCVSQITVVPILKPQPKLSHFKDSFRQFWDD